MQTLYLVRTGRTRLSGRGRLQGRSEDRLTAEGRDDARAAAERLAGAGVRTVHASPLPRAVETAGLLAGPLGPEVSVRIHPGLTDVDVGTWSGRTMREVRANDRAAHDAFFRYPTAWAFPSGEPMADAERRAFAALHEIADAGGDRPAAVVTHELVIRSVLLRLRRLEGTAMWDPRVPPGSVTALRATPRGLELPTPLEDLLRAAERSSAARSLG